MKKRLSPPITLILIFITACGTAPSGPKPTGVDDIDRIRPEIALTPTDEANALERRASLYRWWRFLWRQGYNMHPFDSIATLLVNYGGTEPEALEAINGGYALLEKMYASPEFHQEVKGSPGESASRTDWPHFHGTDGSQRGYSPDAGPSEGALAWRFPKGISWHAKPVVEDGKIYLSSPGIDVYGYCLDEESGKILWKGRQYGMQFYSYYGSRHDPVLTEERVMFRTGHREIRMFVHHKADGILVGSGGEGTGGPAGKPAAFTAYIQNGRTLVLADATAGTPVWHFESEEYFSGDPLLLEGMVSVATNRGLVLCFDPAGGDPVWEVDLEAEVRGGPVAGKEHLYISGKEGTLFALDLKSGSTQWTFETGKPEPGAYQYFSTPVEQDGRVYAGTAASVLYCLEAGTGKKRWETEMSDWVRSAPLLLEDRVFVATLDGRITALKDVGDSAEKLWSEPVSPHGFTADLAGSEKGILAGGRDHILYSLDPEKGDVNWKRGILDGAFVDGEFVSVDWTGGLQPSPVIADGILYIGGSDGFVNALDAETGKEIWRFETMGSVSLSPVVAGDRIYFSHLGGTSEHYTLDYEPAYYALDRKTGLPVWESNEFGSVWVGSAYADNTLFFGNCDGYFFGVDAASGKKLWEYNSALNTPHEGRPLDGNFIHGFPPGVYCNPATDGKRFYSGSWSGYYYCFTPDGKMIWRCQTNNGYLWGGLPDSAAPILWGDHLYVQKIGHNLAAINIHTGKIDWEWTGVDGFLQNGTAAAHDGRVIGAVTRQATMLPYNATLIAFDDVENGGEILWKHRGGGGLTTPVLTEDKLVFGSTCDVYLTCLDPATGKMKWKFYTGGEMMENGPAIYGNKFYAHCKNGWLYAMR